MGATLWLAACAPSGSAQSASDVQCPAGQSFDGQFCVADQNTASKETPIDDEPAAQVKAPSKEGTSPETPTSSQGGDGQPATETPEEGQDATTGESGDGNEEGEKPVDAETSFPDKSTAAPVDYAMASQAGPVMQYFASSHLPAGARAVGVPFAGQFAEGQVLVKKVQLPKDSCTTVVGVALPPVTELHIQLVDPEESVELAADEAQGPQSVLGSREDCFVAATSRSVLLIVTVESGQGVAAVQVFQQ